MSQLESLSSGKSYPNFCGDTVRVHKVKEGEKERIQVFEGVCIAKKNAGLNSSFTVERFLWRGNRGGFTFISPQINKIELVKSGSVRRSKLYYLRKRSGKSARILKNIYSKTENNGDNINKQEQQDASSKVSRGEVKDKDLKASQPQEQSKKKVNDKLNETKSEPQEN